MMGNKCLLRKGNWSGRSALTAVIEVLRSLSASTVGMSPCTLVLFRKGNTTVSINCCALRSGEDSDEPGCMERWKWNIAKSYKPADVPYGNALVLIISTFSFFSGVLYPDIWCLLRQTNMEATTSSFPTIIT